ncbi:Xylose isomerase domain-containing protein TIM barrel [Gemmatirosa kalamazoonensis]|uniref:Xylose isomerase domain-containing protein TIM barrel n=1 Tax=Gemmatirosa kalamazoonensis TaxID=861299 RepID=W0RF22_9BACT|nr:TIM barrel protein [Gemmatirosa kalamazoonensis]AHG89391.1 Xylose isomerase domain-containing protein TIM barrel [Gemmatirosa kalamazoonensis]
MTIAPPDARAADDAALDDHRRDYESLAERLDRRGLRADDVVDAVRRFEVAVPSWALGTGGTRFGRFPGPGEPRTLDEKLEDAAVVHRLTGATPRVSLHLPWDDPRDPDALKAHAAQLGLGFDAVNSNTFQDQQGQRLSYKLGSFSHPDAAVRRQAVDHNLHVVEVGRALGAEAITIWLADGSNYPGQMSLRRSFDRVLDCLREVYAALPAGWRLFTEHKPYEPAFYATVVQDWGSSLLLAQSLGDRAQCLVDLGHHLPNTNIEMVVARLLGAGKLGGFHFNDSKYGDDDLTAGSIKPYALFLVFHELVLAERDRLPSFRPAYMIDQSHNLKDPVEDLLQTVDQLQLACAKAWLVDHDALAAHQESGDVLMAERTLKDAFETDARPLVAEARRRAGAALDPVRAFRTSGYRATKSAERVGGIVEARGL